ncbi:MAG TPA: phosphoglycerate kinase [Flavobacteriales bacterium]|nr:phosphoglycerate kinase [Flavobacteriales bacterium]
MKKLENINFAGKKALIRVDFNVPLDSQFNVTDDTRIRRALPTVNHILKNGGAVILMSHLGRPKGGYEEKFSLAHVLPTLSNLLGIDVKFVNDCVSDDAFAASGSLEMGQVLLLENLRFYPHETSGDLSFSKSLARHGDVYINDAFGTAHRAHASTTIVAQFFENDRAFGFLMQSEIDHINKFLEEGKRPLTAIMGGAKVSSKINVIENMLTKVDHLIVGGGMIYSFIKAEGGQVGNSLVEDDKLDVAKSILNMAKEKGVEIHLPEDSVVADQFSNDAATRVVSSDAIPEGWMGMDIGPNACAHFREVIMNSQTILWNGPMGVFEMSNFAAGSKEVAKALADATKNGAYSLIGGGDSVAAINAFGMSEQVSYISTGGGALMEYLEGITLPGIKAILD